MGIAADILALRDHHFSSVAELLSALDKVCDAPPDKNNSPSIFGWHSR